MQHTYNTINFRCITKIEFAQEEKKSNQNECNTNNIQNSPYIYVGLKWKKKVEFDRHTLRRKKSRFSIRNELYSQNAHNLITFIHDVLLKFWKFPIVSTTILIWKKSTLFFRYEFFFFFPLPLILFLYWNFCSDIADFFFLSFFFFFFVVSVYN